MARRRVEPEPVVWWRRFTPVQRGLAGAVAALVAGVALAAVLWPDARAEPPRERQYLEFTACLLTGRDGVRDPAAAPVWAAMQDASAQTRAKVQYQEVTGEQTVDNAVPFLNGLAQGPCALIFAAGEVPVGAVAKSAATFPAKRFVTVGGGAKSSNVEVVDAAAPHDVIVQIIGKAVSMNPR